MNPPADAFTTFFRDTYPRVVLYAELRMGDHALAEDIATDAFRVAWQKFPSESAPTLSWVLVITRNLIGNEYRRQARMAARLEHLTPVDEDDPEQLAHLEVRRAVRRLRLSDRELLYMAYWEDLPTDVIADLLHVSPGSIWVRLHRIRTRLRCLLEDEPVPATPSQETPR